MTEVVVYKLHTILADGVPGWGNTEACCFYFQPSRKGEGRSKAWYKIDRGSFIPVEAVVHFESLFGRTGMAVAWKVL